MRALRGGSWNNKPSNLRSANRNRNRPDEANNNTGFRLASTPSPWAGTPSVMAGGGVLLGVHSRISRTRRDGCVE
ncbi:SUMF1/EgtB/PvdO family nonheme iron enzyme [Methylomonas sp. 2B]|uniref:SUMF1/EgtB/PvdO family nonheme iron enzyme n=1 Tax=Methylomonas TaxID=416 RepID=UPI0012F668A7